MAVGKFVSYLRVSTDKQGRSGLGLEAQREGVARYLNGGRWQLVAEYVEVESGKRNSRPQLQAAISHAKATGAKPVIARLDRLARNLHFVSSLQERGVDFVAADMPDANRLTIHIIAAVAEALGAAAPQRKLWPSGLRTQAGDGRRKDPLHAGAWIFGSKPQAVRPGCERHHAGH